jgi:hypothetical protein
MASSFAPTAEQLAIMSAFEEGGPTVVKALAGTGKTTTLKAISGIQPTRPGTYLAFNKSVARAAEGTFPGRVNVTTAHALAYKAIGHTFGHRLPGNPGATRMSAKRMSTFMRVKAAQFDTGTLNPVVVTRMAQATVANFIKSPDRNLGPAHIPARIIAHHSLVDLVSVVLPVADKIWADLSSTNGKFFFTHDVYLKHWALTNPVIPSDYIMFDEAQDSDPVIASIVAKQAAQLCYVGDENQAIYGWRGAINAMSNIAGAKYYPLTKSFRFGPNVAEAANEWLELLGSDLRVVGHDPIRSTVGELTSPPRAILCRTNGTALGWVLAFHARNIKVALAPGDKSAGKDIERFAWAARDLMNGEGTDHPDLVGFTTWNEVVQYAEEEEDGADLKRLVGIINRIGYPAVIDAIRGLSLEHEAEVTVSTAHKAKGLEWDTVKVADDFVPPSSDDEDGVDPADLMLAYVTVTRAKLQLDPGPLGEPGLWTP